MKEFFRDTIDTFVAILIILFQVAVCLFIAFLPIILDGWLHNSIYEWGLIISIPLALAIAFTLLNRY